MDGASDYEQATARAAKKYAEAQAAEAYELASAEQTRLLTINAHATEAALSLSLVGLDNARRLGSAQHTGEFEIAIANAEKDYSVAKATSDKQFQLDTLNKVEEEQRNQSLSEANADANLAHTTAIADAKLAWQNLEIEDQATYSNLQATANKTAADGQATVQYAYESSLAAAMETRDYALADAASFFWLANSDALNNQRTALAAADIAYWSVQEDARVDAHQAINTAMYLPWTEYLVVAAETQRDWMASVSDDYMDLAANRNLAETTYAQRLAAAYAIREKATATARKENKVDVAAAQRDAAYARALSVSDYLFALGAPASQYATSMAQADHDHDVAVAQASRNYVFDEDYNLRNTEIETANTALQQAQVAAAYAWYGAEASQQANKFYDFASAQYDLEVDLIAADVALINAIVAAEKGYDNEESAAYLQSTTSWANLEAVYRQFEANTFAAAVIDAAAAHPSPWISYDIQTYADKAIRITAETNAVKAKTIDQATAQAAAETAQTNADAFWKTAQANATGVFRNAAALANLTLAYGQSAGIAALGLTGVYRTELPHLEEAPDIGYDYVVSVGSSSDYSIALPSADSTSSWYGYGYYYGWNWGGWGYYGYSHWWYDNPWYGGYWYVDYWYGDAGAVYLSEPTEQFPQSFWDIAGEADELEWFREQLGEVVELNRDLVPDAAVWSVALAPPAYDRFDPIVSIPTQTEVQRALEQLEPTIAEIWGFLGRTAQRLLPDRSDLAAADAPSEPSGSASALDRNTDDSQPKSLASNGMTAETNGDAPASTIAKKIDEEGAEKLSRLTPGPVPLKAGKGETVDDLRKKLAGYLKKPSQLTPLWKVGNFDEIADTTIKFNQGLFKGYFEGIRTYLAIAHALVEAGILYHPTSSMLEETEKWLGITGPATLLREHSAATINQLIEDMRELGVVIASLPDAYRAISRATPDMIAVSQELMGLIGRELPISTQMGTLATFDPGIQKMSITEKAANIINLASPELVVVLNFLSELVKKLGPEEMGYITGVILYEVTEWVVFAALSAPAGSTLGVIRASLTPVKLIEKLKTFPQLAKYADKLSTLADVFAKNGIKMLRAADNILPEDELVKVLDDAVDVSRGAKRIEDVSPIVRYGDELAKSKTAAVASSRLGSVTYDLTGKAMTPAEAIAIAVEHGVEIPSDVKILIYAASEFENDELAKWAGKLKSDSNLGWKWEELTWFRPTEDCAGKVVVRIHEDMLKNPAAFAGTLAHELHEVEEIRKLYQARKAIPEWELYDYLWTSKHVDSGGSIHKEAVGVQLKITETFDKKWYTIRRFP